MSIYTPVVNRFEQKDNFVRLWKFTFLLPPTESAMLSVLLDCDKYNTKNRLSEDERYFKCSKEGYLKKMLPGWKLYTIEETLKKLVNEGLIHTRVIQQGLTKNTFVMVDEKAIENLEREYAKRVGSDITEYE